MKKDLVKKIILIEFILMLLIPLLLFNFEKGKTSKAENKVLASFPDLVTKDSINISGFFDLETWFSDNLGLREQLITIKRNIVSNIYHQSPNNKVEYGRDGWLFFTCEHNLDIATETYPGMSEARVKAMADKLSEISNKLEEKGIDFVYTAPPAKTSIYPEYVSISDKNEVTSPCDILIDYLNDNTNVKALDLKPVLMANKGKGLLYFKTDTHWNDTGAYIAYKALIDKFNEWGIFENEQYVEVEWQETSSLRDLARMISLDYLETSNSIVIKNKKAQFISNYTDYYPILGTFSDDFVIKMFKNENVQDKKLLIYGDSMVENYFMPLLAEKFSEIVYIKDYVVNDDVIEEVKPDVVLLGTSERYINFMPESLDDWN